MAIPRIILLTLTLVFLAACFPGVHRLDIQQGNVVEPDMLDKLEIGMNKRQVRFIMGTPLVIDAFNPDRWDYFYSYLDQNREYYEYKVTLFFEEGLLSEIEKEYPELVEDSENENLKAAQETEELKRKKQQAMDEGAEPTPQEPLEITF